MLKIKRIRGIKTVNKKLPHPIMMELLKRLYKCPFFKTCPEAKWSPKLGHVPRGYLGCTGNPDEVEAVFVRAEPGHSLENEKYRFRECRSLACRTAFQSVST